MKFDSNITIFFEENGFENAGCKLVAVLHVRSRRQPAVPEWCKLPAHVNILQKAHNRLSKLNIYKYKMYI